MTDMIGEGNNRYLAMCVESNFQDNIATLQNPTAGVFLSYGQRKCGGGSAFVTKVAVVVINCPLPNAG